MGDKRDQLARRWIIQAAAQGVDGKACLCAATLLRRVAVDKGSRWDKGERRQLDELLDYEDSTVSWESPVRESESALGHSRSALSGQRSKIGENRCSDSARDSSERIPSSCVSTGLVSESQGMDVSCVFL